MDKTATVLIGCIVVSIPNYSCCLRTFRTVLVRSFIYLVDHECSTDTDCAGWHADHCTTATCNHHGGHGHFHCHCADHGHHNNHGHHGAYQNRIDELGAAYFIYRFLAYRAISDQSCKKLLDENHRNLISK